MKHLSKYVVILFLMAVQAIGTLAQQATVTGVLKDSTSMEPEPYATIGLREKAGSGAMTATTSDTEGRFTLKAKTGGEYQLVVSSLGKMPIQRDVKIASGETLDLGIIFVTENTQKIEGVEVVAQKQIVKMEADKLTYSVEDDADSKTQTVIELLRKVPMVTVDAQENITVNGSSSFKVYVDGKPNMMMSKNPKEVFRSMPASVVKSIEVITNPGAKYDAEGTGGVLCITMQKQGDGKSNAADGFTVNTRAAIATTQRRQASVYVAEQKGRHSYTVNAFMFHEHQVDGHVDLESRQKDGLVTKTESSLDQDWPYRTFSAGYTLNIDTLRSIEADVETSGWAEKAETDETTRIVMGEETRSEYAMKTDQEEGGRDVSASISYNRSFANIKDGKWTTLYTMSHERAESEADRTVRSVMSGSEITPRNENAKTESRETTQSVVTDVEVPCGEVVTLLTGAKYAGHRSNQENTLTAGTSETDEYKYRYDLAAVYAEGEARFEKTKLRFGLRYEHTWQTQESDHKFSADYGNIVPSAVWSQTLSQSQNIGLSYNVRIKRPSISNLDPNVDRSENNVLSIKHGNPDLEAERSHTMKLTYNTFGQKAMLSLNLSHTICRNGIYGYSRSEGAIIETTYGNILRSNTTDLSVYTRLTLGKKTNVMLQGSAAYVYVRSKELDQSRKGWRPRGFVSLQQTLPADIEMMIGGVIEGTRMELQTTSKGLVGAVVNLSRSFLDKRLTAGLTAITTPDKDGAVRITEEKKATDYESTMKARIPIRRIEATISFRFGKGHFKERQRSTEVDDEGGSDKNKGPHGL
ncbi:MAG: TonB-dependent receptor [Bacteroidales bacterium]|nr:TonB-dependent receptor [Bacteroidales bacterium]